MDSPSDIAVIQRGRKIADFMFLELTSRLENPSGRFSVINKFHRNFKSSLRLGAIDHRPELVWRRLNPIQDEPRSFNIHKTFRALLSRFSALMRNERRLFCNVS